MPLGGSLLPGNKSDRFCGRWEIFSVIIPTKMNLLIGTLINSYMKKSNMQAIIRNVTCSVSYDVMRNRTHCSADMPAWDVFRSTSLETEWDNTSWCSHTWQSTVIRLCRVVLRQNREETKENTKANLISWTVTSVQVASTMWQKKSDCLLSVYKHWQDTSCDVNNMAAAV